VAAAGPSDLDLEKFEPGSMRPKLEAAIEFVRRTGRRAAIGRLDDAPALLGGTAGTVITQAQAGLRLRDQP
jgi:carbamate kinase